MVIFKKLIFSLPLLLSLMLFCSYTNYFLQNPLSFLGFNTGALSSIGGLLISLYLVGLFLITFLTLASDFKIILPILLVLSLTPLTIIPFPFNLILVAGLLFSFLIVFLLLHRKLQTYLNFDVFGLLGPHLKRSLTLMTLTVSIALFFALDLDIKNNGFALPDSLLNLSIQTSLGNQLSQEGVNLSLPANELQALKNNPDLLAQYGLDPQILDQFSSDKPITQEVLLKGAVENQVQNMLKPYEQFIAPILALLFFTTMNWVSSALSIIPLLFLSFLFTILDRVGFTHYEIETRQVKKLIV